MYFVIIYFKINTIYKLGFTNLKDALCFFSSMGRAGEVADKRRTRVAWGASREDSICLDGRRMGPGLSVGDGTFF